MAIIFPEKTMIDWNNNGTIDPEEIILTAVILGGEGREDDGQDDEDAGEEAGGGGDRAFDPSPHLRHAGCLFSLLAIPFLLLFTLFHHP